MTIRAASLFWSAVVKGIVAVPLMVAMMIVVSSTRTCFACRREAP
jgi:hypothetical protein